jgi:hypothetical protein
VAIDALFQSRVALLHAVDVVAAVYGFEARWLPTPSDPDNPWRRIMQAVTSRYNSSDRLATGWSIEHRSPMIGGA